MIVYHCHDILACYKSQSCHDVFAHAAMMIVGLEKILQATRKAKSPWFGGNFALIDKLYNN